MPTTLNVTSNYSGALAGEILVEAMKKSDTIDKQLITVIPNAIGTGYLPRLEYTADLQDYSCGWDPTGDVDYSEVEVTLKKFKLQHELCKDEFSSTFQAQKAGLFSANSEIPDTMLDAILMAIVQNLGVKVDNFIWNAATVGLIAKMNEATSGVIELQNVVLTQSNVIDELGRVYEAIPEEIIEEDDLVIVVSSKVARLYKQAQTQLGLNTTVGDKPLDYLGVRLATVGALSGDVMFAYRVKNVGFLTGLEADLNEVRIIDDAERGDGIIRTSSVLAMGVGFTFGAEIVHYGDFV